MVKSWLHHFLKAFKKNHPGPKCMSKKDHSNIYWNYPPPRMPVTFFIIPFLGSGCQGSLKGGKIHHPWQPLARFAPPRTHRVLAKFLRFLNLELLWNPISASNVLNNFPNQLLNKPRKESDDLYRWAPFEKELKNWRRNKTNTQNTAHNTHKHITDKTSKNTHWKTMKTPETSQNTLKNPCHKLHPCKVICPWIVWVVVCWSKSPWQRSACKDHRNSPGSCSFLQFFFSGETSDF